MVRWRKGHESECVEACEQQHIGRERGDWQEATRRAVVEVGVRSRAPAQTPAQADPRCVGNVRVDETPIKSRAVH